MRTYKFVLLLCLFIIIICIVLRYCSYKEPFTVIIPKNVKSLVRPIHRNIRMQYEGFYDKTTSNIFNIFRKAGLY